MKKHDVVEILWLDSQGCGGWTYDTKMVFSKEELTQTTVGYLLNETDFSIAVMQSCRTVKITGERNIDNMIEIPKCSILNVEVLRRGSKQITDKNRP